MKLWNIEGKKNGSRYITSTFEETPVCFNEDVMGVDENTEEKFSIQKEACDIPNQDAYTFMVKIWAEEIEIDTGQILWRGYIKNILEKDSAHHFQDLKGLERSLRPYLEKLDINDKKNK